MQTLTDRANGIEILVSDIDRDDGRERVGDPRAAATRSPSPGDLLRQRDEAGRSAWCVRDREPPGRTPEPHHRCRRATGATILTRTAVTTASAVARGGLAKLIHSINPGEPGRLVDW